MAKQGTTLLIIFRLLKRGLQQVQHLDRYVVGGGAEWALDRQWSLKAEYLFLSFGSISTSVSDLNTPGSGFGNNALATKVDLDAQIARVGLNHKF